MSNQNRQWGAIPPGDRELIVVHEVVMLIERCRDQGVATELLTALAALETVARRALPPREMMDDSLPPEKHGWKRLDRDRERVNEILEGRR